MSIYTKVNIKRSVLEIAKRLAEAENRSVSNYIETLILEADKSATDGGDKE